MDGKMYIVKRTGPRMNVECMCVLYKGYEISCAFDDSCGSFPNLSRGDIRIYKNGLEDMTKMFTKSKYDVIEATLDNLNKVVKKIDRLLKKGKLPKAD